MKYLTSITLLMAVPTVISGLYGMNVQSDGMPFANTTAGFAIVLALNTKEVYTSLLVGIASGALLYANGNLELALTTLFFNEDGGMVSKLSDSSNVGILVFLVMLGILVALMNKAGGSAGGMLSVYYITRNTLYLTCKGRSTAYARLKTILPLLTGAARYALTKALGRKKGRSYGAFKGAVDFWNGKMGRMEG